MDEARFQTLARRAKLLTGDYGAGFLTGLRRHYHGESFGDPGEHEARLRVGGEFTRGYQDGLAGGDPAPAIGRPRLPDDAPRAEKRVRSIRLSDEHWAKLKSLGMDWLESVIDKA